MENKDEKEIVTHLLEIGCCKRCALRMLCRSVNFTDAEGVLEPTKLSQDEDGSTPKKIKTNPCIVCLDILEYSFMSKLVADVCLDTVREYDSESYVCYLSAPASVIIREHSIKCYLKERFPNFYTDLKTIRQLSKIWKVCISKHLDKCLGKELDNNSLFSISFNLDYDSEIEETAIMTKIDSLRFRDRQKSARKFNGEVFSRNAIEESLSSTSHNDLKKHLTLPPSIPTYCVKIKSIQVHSEPIFIAGRYCKHSRTIGQTPWLHEDTNITDCVQDFIFRGIEKVLGYSKTVLTFSASGREDYDVRCLGRGRPFYIQIDNPKITKISFDTFRKLEVEVNKCHEISIRDMQIVQKCDLKEIKNGEQFKTKHYTALCLTDCTNVEKAVKTINDYGAFDIKQQTPLRVLHRRTVDTRKKTIHEMKAKLIKGHNNMFILDVLTQAGTYVKELVHGDLNRTNPNISTIIGASTDIVALDVNSINLDWPPTILFEEQINTTITLDKTNGESTLLDKTSVGLHTNEIQEYKSTSVLPKEVTDVDGKDTAIG